MTKITPISTTPATPVQIEPASAPDQILRLPDVRLKVGIGTTKIYELMSLNEFPKKIPLGGRNVGWSSNELDAWIESRKAERVSAA